MRELIVQINKRIRALPRDRRNLSAARDVLAKSKSLLEVVQAAGYKLDATETKFFRSIPPSIGGAIRGAILDTLNRPGSAGLNFDCAYRTVGTGFSLTMSSTGARGDVEMVLQGPAPDRGSSRRASPRASRAGAARRKASTRKRAPARKRVSR